MKKAWGALLIILAGSLVFSGLMVGLTNATNTTTDTRVTTLNGKISLNHNTVAFAVRESDSTLSNKDFNLDGDTSDSLIGYYSIISGAPIYVAIGIGPSLSGNIIAFQTSEAELKQYLNGDPDQSDNVIRYYDISTRSTVNTAADGVNPSIDGDIIAFSTREDIIPPVDLDGDGLIGEPYSFIQYYDISAAAVTNIAAHGLSPSVDGDIVAFNSFEVGSNNVDLNGDGDLQEVNLVTPGSPFLDVVIRYYDINVGAVINTMVDGTTPSINGKTIAFQTAENSADLDLNADGDKTDNLIRYYQIKSGSIFNTMAIGIAPTFDGKTITFSTIESQANLDLNGDNDKTDNVIRYYDIYRKTLMNTGIVGTFPSVKGNLIALVTSESMVGANLNGDGDTTDFILRWYDIPIETLANTGFDGSTVSVSGIRIAFFTSESLVNKDLNGDSDTADNVLRYLDITNGDIVNTKEAGKSSVICGNIIAFYGVDNVIRYYDINTGLTVNTGVTGNGGRLATDGKIISFTHSEGAIQEDINGDGDMTDPIIMYYDIVSATLVNIRQIGSSAAINNGIIPFQTAESQADIDFNGDGDKLENVIRYYDVASGKTVNTAVVGESPSIEGTIIAFHTLENQANTDLNSDGDISDRIIRYYDISKKTLSNTGAVGTSPAISNKIIAFFTIESTEGSLGVDLNGDGDKTDSVARYYDVAKKSLVNTKAVGSISQSAISGKIIALQSSESSVGDLNGDGDMSDTVVRYFNIASSPLVTTGAIGAVPSISGNIIAFQTLESSVGNLNGDTDSSDSIIRYLDISTGTLGTTGAVGNSAAVSGNIIAFLTPESMLGQDLNGDGFINATIIRYFSITSKIVFNTGVVAAGLGVSVDGNYIAFTTTETILNLDVNGDGDITDNVIQYYDITSSSVTTVGLGGSAFIRGNIIAFFTAESQAKLDLNSDGDPNDFVVQYYDISSSGPVINPKIVGSYPSISGNIIAFQTLESMVSTDLNGDGDQLDNVIRYYNMATAALVNTGAIGNRAYIDSGIIAFSTNEIALGSDLDGDGDLLDATIRYYNITKGVLVNTGVNSLLNNNPSISGNKIAFQMMELFTGDLNGDGDVADQIVRYLIIDNKGLSDQVKLFQTQKAINSDISAKVLLAQLKTAETLKARGYFEAARVMYSVFIESIRWQSGKTINVDAALTLMHSAQAIRNNLY